MKCHLGYFTKRKYTLLSSRVSNQFTAGHISLLDFHASSSDNPGLYTLLQKKRNFSEPIFPVDPWSLTLTPGHVLQSSSIYTLPKKKCNFPEKDPDRKDPMINHCLRLPYRNDARIAKICNLWTFWLVIQLMNQSHCTFYMYYMERWTKRLCVGFWKDGLLAELQAKMLHIFAILASFL